MTRRRSFPAAQCPAAIIAAKAEPLEDRKLLAATIGGLDGDSLEYSGGSAVVIDQGTSASVTGTIAVGGTLTVSIASGGDASEDVLSIRNEGTGLGQIGVSGSNITYSGLPLGTFTGGTGGSDLVVTFNAISLVAIGDVLQNITYQNTDAVSPTTGTRTVEFTINDGLGILSTPVSAAVDVVNSLSA
ncbi:MAG TPA: hypothetical protein VK137_20375, partial [Planctomycetaceae bacterium]|nr:hypothetical protein [Planctomycetaceae bacterium]